MDINKYRTNDHFFVLTGGPGVGKTSVLDYLNNKNIRSVNETARSIIKKEMYVDGEALPWKNKNLYKDRMLDLSVKDYLTIEHRDKKVAFFDRGIPDTLAYARLEHLPVSNKLLFYTQKYRYNSTVFIFPPWEAIYNKDQERKQEFSEVVKTHTTMVQVYRDCDYEPIMMPKSSIEERGEFILKNINKNLGYFGL